MRRALRLPTPLTRLAPLTPLAPLMLLTLSACIIVPFPSFPGGRTYLRGNVDQKAASAVIPGTTTMADLVLKYGEPDGSGPDGTWMAWTGAENHGGTGLFIAVGAYYSGAATYNIYENVEYRRLRVTFDRSGHATHASLDTKSCRTTYPEHIPDPRKWAPCPGWEWVRGEQP